MHVKQSLFILSSKLKTQCTASQTADTCYITVSLKIISTSDLTILEFMLQSADLDEHFFVIFLNIYFASF